MTEEKLIGQEDVLSPESFAAKVNKWTAQMSDLVAKKAGTDQVKQMYADFDLECKDMLKKYNVQDAEYQDMKKQFASALETIKIQGESITKLKSVFNPQEGIKTFKSAVLEQLKKGVFDDFIEKKTGRASFTLDTKELAFTGTYGSGAAQQAYMPFQVPQAPDVEQFDVRLIVPTGTIDSEKLEYPQERAASRTNNSDWTTENGETTASAFGFTMATANSERYTDHIKVSRRAMRNTNWLAAYIQAALLQAFITKLNTGVIAGDGSGNTLNGLLNNANTFAGTGMENKFRNADYFSVLRAARAEMKKTYKRTPNHVMLDPLDYAIMSDTRTTIGDFLTTKFMNAGGIGYDNILGMRSVESADITDGAYLLADIAANTVQLLFNGPIEILASDSDDDNFTKNLITLKIEADVMLPIYNTNALLKGTLAADLTTINAGA